MELSNSITQALCCQFVAQFCFEDKEERKRDRGKANLVPRSQSVRGRSGYEIRVKLDLNSHTCQ